MFYIIDLGITIELPTMEEGSGKLHRLPPHLYDSKNKKSYWLGMLFVLTLY